MILTKFKSIIETLNVAGINQVIFDKKEDHILVRGVDNTNPEDDVSIFVFSKIDNDILEFTLAISNVSVLLKRMNLFDIETSNIKLEKRSNYIKWCELREKRKKVTYVFSDPRTIRAPKSIIDDDINNKIIFNKEDVVNIIKANSAMSSKYFTLKGIENDIILELSNEISGKYEIVVGENKSGEWENNWLTNSIMKLIRYVIKTKDNVTLSIGKRGIIYINVNDISFMILPQTK